MNKRIKILRKSLDLSQKQFAEKIGLKQNAISYMEKEGATVTEQNIKSICFTFNVNENWLRTGEGNMFEKQTNQLFELASTTFQELKPEYQEYILKQIDQLLAMQNKEK